MIAYLVVVACERQEAHCVDELRISCLVQRVLGFGHRSQGVHTRTVALEQRRHRLCAVSFVAERGSDVMHTSALAAWKHDQPATTRVFGQKMFARRRRRCCRRLHVTFTFFTFLVLVYNENVEMSN